MKIYLMSDIHGQADFFFQLLEEMKVSDRDELYVLGDVVGKGAHSTEVLRYLMAHEEKALLLRGNHEQKLLQYFGADTSACIEAGKMRMKAPLYSEKAIRSWAEDDGKETILEFLRMPAGERENCLDFISRTALSCRRQFYGRFYLMVHGAPSDQAAGACRGFDVLENRYKRADVLNRTAGRETVQAGCTADKPIIITGHTPTFRYGARYAGKLIRTEDKILLDCGAGWGLGLGCLCLTDGTEFYARR